MGRTIKRQVPWVRPLFDQFVKDGGLTIEDASILEKKVFDNWTWVKICDEFHIGRTTLRNKLNLMKKKYDYLHIMYPGKYPKRVVSDTDKAQMEIRIGLKRD